jgi:hypothetical protein
MTMNVTRSLRRTASADRHRARLPGAAEAM